MRTKILHKIKRFLEPRAIVLMYHRIAAPASDLWEITVAPERFEEHLQVLQRMGNVVPLHQVVNGSKNNRLRRNSIAITFDDGYIDNLLVAKPLLEKYNLPATFFIASGNIGNEKEFWWDELEQLILFSEKLPSSFSMVIKDTNMLANLSKESLLTADILQKHHCWIAGPTGFPTKRAELFFNIWEQLRTLPHTEQQNHLNNIRNWAGTTLIVRPAYRTMSADELKTLALGDLFTIGAHTVTHPALGYYPLPFQHTEITKNQKTLQEIINKKIDLLSYPFGNYNMDTIQIVKDNGFIAAFTTEGNTITPKSPSYRFGRFQAKNLTGAQLMEHIKKWRLL